MKSVALFFLGFAVALAGCGDQQQASTQQPPELTNQPAETASTTIDQTQEKAPDVVQAIANPAEPGASSAADLVLGKSVYDGKCKACHATGAAGAPKLDDAANWAPRIEQGMDVLVRHAIEGFKGTVGYMPPKGGFMSLSDNDVAAAVAYMVSQSN